MKTTYIITAIMIVCTTLFLSGSAKISDDPKPQSLIDIFHHMRSVCPQLVGCTIDEDATLRVFFITSHYTYIVAYQEISPEGLPALAVLVTHRVFQGPAQKIFIRDDGIDGCVDYASTALPSHIYVRTACSPSHKEMSYEEYWQDVYNNTMHTVTQYLTQEMRTSQ